MQWRVSALSRCYQGRVRARSLLGAADRSHSERSTVSSPQSAPTDSGAEVPQEQEIDHGELIDQLQWACRIADLSGVDLFVTDADSGRFLDFNRSAHQRLGYSRAELLAMGAEQIQADPDHDAAWLQQQLQLLRQQQQGCFTTRHRCRNGNVLDVLVNHTVAQLNGRLVIITAVIDITVQRNGYGRQVDSFETDVHVEGEPRPFHAVFIRAPKVVAAAPNVHVLAAHEGVPVLARQGSVMVASFHPELTGDARLHRQFLQYSNINRR